MRFLYLPCFLLLFVFETLTAQGQVCTGSLGDPVIHEDFGAGTGLGLPLPVGVTSYFYANKECPDDSWYSIVNRIDDCFGLSWHNIRDASNVPNGYFMLVNADANPGIFYTQRADASSFCSNTTYEFAAMVTNVMRTSACGNGGIRPNLTFRIETEAGALIKKFDSGDLPPDGIWRKYGTFFTLTSNASLIVKIINNAPGGCGNDLALDDITFRACGPQISTSYNMGVPADVEICEGTNNSYVITATAPADYQNFQWQRNVSGVWEDILGQTGNTYAVPPTGNFAPGLYQYRVAAVSNGNVGSLNCRIFSQPNTITVNSTPVVVPPVDQIVCIGSTLQLTATGGNAYVWSGPNLPQTTTNTLTINSADINNDGIYTVYTISDRGCPSAPQQFRVTVIPPVTANVNTAMTDVCIGQNVNLEATGGLYYQWFPAAGLSQADIPNPIASPTQTTTYTVRVSNDACFDEKTVTVNVLQYPVAIAPQKKVIFEGQPVVLNAAMRGDNIAETSWSPTTFLDDPQSLTPTATPPYDITYTLTVRSASCGESTSSVFVRVYRKVTIPNTFTPNGDGFNDLWNISQLYTYPESTTTVFTRSGQQVFHSEGYNNPWNGTLNGQQLPAGTYYYVIDLKNGTKPLQGWVTLLR